MLNIIRQKRDNFKDAAIEYKEVVDIRDTTQNKIYNATYLIDQMNILIR